MNDLGARPTASRSEVAARAPHVERAPYLSAQRLIAAMDDGVPGYVLGSLGAHALARFTLAGTQPSGTTRLEATHPAPLAALDTLAGERAASGTPFPFARHVGYLTYELGAHCERFPESNAHHGALHTPLAELATYDAGYVADHGARAGFVWSYEPSARDAVRALLDRAATRASSGNKAAPQPPSHLDLADARRAHASAVRAIRAYIAAGDIYQANLTHRFALPRPASEVAFASRLFGASAAPFAAYLSFGDHALASASPERFLAFDLHAGWAETRPIKGTRARAAAPKDDARARAALEASTKDHAEHVMIVDLERNDLGRLARPGGVRVPVLARTESFAEVHHLVSIVEADLREGVRFSELLRATFPGGSITGAPKVRAMEIIAEQERAPRGVAYGAFGWLDGAGRGDLALAIRTAHLAGQQLFFSVGGGVVADSTPQDEWAELLAKARGVLGALGVSATGS